MKGLLLVVASLSYAAGGVLMKPAGLGAAWPLAGVFFFFVLGAGLQTWVMRGGELGVTYLVVLGLEGVITAGAGIWLYGEAVTPTRLAGMGLILAGAALLRA